MGRHDVAQLENVGGRQRTACIPAARMTAVISSRPLPLAVVDEPQRRTRLSARSWRGMPPIHARTAAPARDRRALLPSPTLPITWFAGAHVAFALACATLTVDPSLAGSFHYHPRLVALVHLVTLGWITGSIVGALYIVVPLAFGVPLRAGPADRVGAAAFWAGTALMVWGFWIGAYARVAMGGPLVLGVIVLVGVRVVRGLWQSRLPWGVSLHVTLAFANVLVAGSVGVWLALARQSGTLTISPLAAALAHGHLAVIGWATMMIVGVSYRLIPMFLPAAMPAGAGLAASALLLEAGGVGLAGAFVLGGARLPWTLLVIGGLASFVWQVRKMLGARRPRPVDLPRPDWSTWQTHVALLSLVVTTGLGLWLAVQDSVPAVSWLYGVLGLVGFAAQMVVGIQGRLLPLHAWYRALQRSAQLPARSVHHLVNPVFARAVLCCWVVGLPALSGGLASQATTPIRIGAMALLAGTVINAWQGVRVLRSTVEPPTLAGQEG